MCEGGCALSPGLRRPRVYGAANVWAVGDRGVNVR